MMDTRKIVLFGEYLLRLTPPQNLRISQCTSFDMHWAGSEGNIAVSLAQLGKKVEYVTSLPDNEVAINGIQFLKQYGVEVYNHKREGRVGTYYYETGSGARPGRVLYDRKYSSFSLLQSGEIAWEHLFNEASWLHWSGITPALNENKITLVEEALEKAKQKGITISADFNYRSTLWDYGIPPKNIMPSLLNYCNVILADVDSFKVYFGKENINADVIDEVLNVIHEHLPNAEYIALTMRHTSNTLRHMYIGYLWHKGNVCASKEYDLSQIAERIGAGDAFMAGLIYMLHGSSTPQDAVEFATAAAVLKHTVTGDVNIASEQEILELMNGQKPGGIIR
jgi:2-dehydro-3-deoxygluconokinase